MRKCRTTAHFKIASLAASIFHDRVGGPRGAAGGRLESPPMPTKPNRAALCSALAVCLFALTSLRAQNVIPYAQDRPPGPALSPKEAMAKMQLPQGFKVELAAGEPDVVNPTAMTFDE